MKFKIILSILFSFSLFSLSSAQEILTWDDCLQEAQKNHPDLISAAEGINVQKAAKTITASGLYPQIDADLSTSTTRTTKRTDSYSYGVGASQLFFDGFKTLHDIKVGKENIQAAQQNYRFVSSEVRLNLRAAFVNLLKTQELIKVAEEIVKIRKDNLVLITLRYQSGLEHKGALLTAEANSASANFDLSQAKRNQEYAQRQLTKELGRKEFAPMQVQGDFVVREAVKEKPDFAELVHNNPSVLQAIAKKNAALFHIKSVYGNFSPKLSGAAGTDKKGEDWPPKDDQWSTSLSLTMPLFEGGSRIAQVAQAKAEYKQAEADERGARDSAVVALEKTWAALEDAIETVEVRRLSLVASEERSKIAEAQYSTGFIAFDNWIIIENDLVSAKKAYLEAQSNALLAEANWVQAKGETLEYAQ
jgi:outer membrane protein TolC